MADEQVRDMLSIRGLLDNDFKQTPLREFKGVLDSYGVEEKKPCALNFRDMEVIDSLEPYPFPTGVIEIWPSAKIKSQWGIFGVSLGAIIPEGHDLKDCINSTFHMKMTPGHLLPRKVKDEATGVEEWKDVPKECWEVISLDGVNVDGAGASPQEVAMGILDGNTLMSFNLDALQNDVVRSDPALLSAIINKEFAATAVAKCQFTLDPGGVYHKVPF